MPNGEYTPAAKVSFLKRMPDFHHIPVYAFVAAMQHE
jgi:hypothetical protein